MNLTITAQEQKELQLHSFNGVGIMNCPLENLKQTCLEFMISFDDYQQMAGDNNNNEASMYFDEAYSTIEKAFHHLKQGGVLSLKSRNQLRLVIKYAEKYAAMVFNPTQN